MSSSTAAPLAANLLVNGDAEAGGAPDDQGVVPPDGWTTTGAFTSVVYGGNGLPEAGEAPPGGGQYLFAGGPRSAESTATQLISLSPRATAIDAGRVQATLTGYLGGWRSQTDAASVRAELLNAAGTPRTVISLGQVGPGARGSATGFVYRHASVQVPAGARSVRVTITATRASGAYNDGYADELSLTLGRARAPATHLDLILFKKQFQVTAKDIDRCIQWDACTIANWCHREDLQQGRLPAPRHEPEP